MTLEGMPGSPAEGEPSPYETEWNREVAAGWFDGLRAARIRLIHRFKDDLASHGLTLDRAGEVRKAATGIRPAPLPKVLRDNPNAHPAYDQGWDKGYAQATAMLLARINRQLEADGIHGGCQGSCRLRVVHQATSEVA